ncbi:MAG TPA: tRNA (adenosine(37)-N6)-threonylcarbamoyltransferase complex ATPase subunit type 1 TsaE [Hanamia sp.]|jgi:tRNA threonylcarbamoyladenosine biosynthesis protein TsaE|nr:tRNA (adenosine(37)-N6)-threonylcarbamoyltransferase complex ATPase subunit type 1 TsaE [Hanamia sp.]
MEIFFDLNSIETTASEFLESFDNYKIFAFSGELGAGKTTFISALCKQLKVIEPVTSPTYSIIQEYKTSDGKIIYHIDLYRIKSSHEAMEAGIEDCLNSNEICFIEWPEKAPDIFPNETVFSNFEIVSATKRKLVTQLPA